MNIFAISKNQSPTSKIVEKQWLSKLFLKLFFKKIRFFGGCFTLTS